MLNCCFVDIELVIPLSFHRLIQAIEQNLTMIIILNLQFCIFEVA